jgi:hypothetical protein
MSGAKDVVQPPAERSASGGRDAHPGAGGPSRTASIPGAPGAKYTAAEESELKAIDEKMWKQIMNEVVQQGAEVGVCVCVSRISFPLSFLPRFPRLVCCLNCSVYGLVSFPRSGHACTPPVNSYTALG